MVFSSWEPRKEETGHRLVPLGAQVSMSSEGEGQSDSSVYAPVMRWVRALDGQSAMKKLLALPFTFHWSKQVRKSTLTFKEGEMTIVSCFKEKPRNCRGKALVNPTRPPRIIGGSEAES